MRIGNRKIGADSPPYVIAEIGVNHGGDIDQAIAMTDAAQRAGADAVKLQLFEAERLLSKAARLADYQKDSGAVDPLQMLRALEMSIDDMSRVVERAHRGGLHAIVSIFSVEFVDKAERLSFDAYKTASTDIINRPLIEAMMNTGKPLIISTGAASSDEVAQATNWLGEHPHLLMHCVSSYPTPDDDATLAGREALMVLNPRALGYSDHTTAVDTGALAVAGGACLLEKHFTHDRNARGPDHAASLDPDGLAEYVRLAQRAWKMRGSVTKQILPIERDVRSVSRQSIVTKRDLQSGHVLRREDLTIKRPGTGISPAKLQETIGRRIAKAIEADLPLTEEHLA